MTKPPKARKLAVGHLCVSDSLFSDYWWFQVLIISKCMHGVVAAVRIFAQRGEVVAKREVGVCAFNSHGNYIVDHGKILKLCF